jgi:hypothetical protein
MSDASLPEWWTYPTHCGHGHPWGPGRVIVSWLPCQCGPARAAQPRGSGHRTIACRAPGCRYVCYEPPHEPEPGEASRDRADSWLSRPPACHGRRAAGPRPPRGQARAVRVPRIRAGASSGA